MLTATELANRIHGLSDGRESLVDFEDWFSVHSRKFHRSEDASLIDFVSAVESVFSNFYFGGMDEARAVLALDEVARIAHPFAESVVPVAQDLEMTFGLTRKPPQGTFAFDPVEDLRVAYLG
jgi:hypothetical protein